MKKLLAMLLALALCFALGACSKTDDKKADDKGAASKLKIGVILVHDENTGYDLAHINGIKKAAANTGIKEDQIIWKYSISEDENCFDAATDLVEQGCSYIISDSYGHQSYMQQAAE
ncbi:MAG: BMP family ABC transporter substrate-binding protein, partial [Papillibacter sp.]|nr:BMP family ABC transporter substrate-binding protein [Papillibacter sp.]